MLRWESNRGSQHTHHAHRPLGHRLPKQHECLPMYLYHCYLVFNCSFIPLLSPKRTHEPGRLIHAPVSLLQSGSIRDSPWLQLHKSLLPALHPPSAGPCKQWVLVCVPLHPYYRREGAPLRVIWEYFLISDPIRQVLEAAWPA